MWRILRKTLLLSVLCVLIQSTSSKSSKNQSASKGKKAKRTGSRKPHIILLLADDLGWNDVGFNNPAVKSPHINKLAREGIILNNHYSQTSCSPSRASLLTGRYPSTIGAKLNHENFHHAEDIGLPLKEVLLPEKLKKLGYDTHMIGKWHLGFSRKSYTPTYRGFDHFFGFYGGHTDFWTRKVSGDSACKLHLQEPVVDLHHDGEPVHNRSGIYTTHLFTEETIKAIQSRNRSNPMFLFVSFANTHSPNHIPLGADRKLYKNIAHEPRRIFLTKVSILDEAVGNITNALKRFGMYKDSIIVFASDNGGNMRYGNNWPYRGHKGTVYEGGVKTVAFLHGNRLPRSGVRSDALAHITDWFPTLLKLAKGDVRSMRNPLDGYNIWKALTENQPSPRKEVLLALNTHKKAIRSGNWKLIQREKDANWYYPPELVTKPPPGWVYFSGPFKLTRNNIPEVPVALYNIVGDPEERHDLSCRYPNVVSYLLARLRAHISNMAVFLGNKWCYARAVKTAQKRKAWVPWVEEEEIQEDKPSIAEDFKTFHQELKVKYKMIVTQRAKIVLRRCNKKDKSGPF